ncbi:MAG: WD40-repeat-containing domain protein, partial [Benniella sp.]
RVLEGHYVKKVVYSLKGDQVISAGRDGTLRVCNVQSGNCCNTMTGHENAVFGVACSSNGKIITSTGEDMTVRLWEASVCASHPVVSGHSQEVENVKCPFQGKGPVGSYTRHHERELFTGWEPACHWQQRSYGVQGLTPRKKEPLKQRGAEGTPEMLVRKTSKTSITAIPRSVDSVDEKQEQQQHQVE